jgi:hypothetical protein
MRWVTVAFDSERQISDDFLLKQREIKTKDVIGQERNGQVWSSNSGELVSVISLASCQGRSDADCGEIQKCRISLGSWIRIVCCAEASQAVSFTLQWLTKESIATRPLCPISVHSILQWHPEIPSMFHLG